jgi:hypothetical protein
MRHPVAGALVCVLTSVAPADGISAHRFFSAGVNAGVASHDDGDGLVVGAEASTGIVWHDFKLFGESRLRDVRWVGGYLDALRDFGSGTTRISVGPEAGIAGLGIDMGLLVQLGDGQRWGWSVRPAITNGVISVGVRYARFFDGKPEASFGEASVLLKWPFKVGK